MNTHMKKTRKGFSLIELLIAVVVLGILGAMLLASGSAAQNKARVAVASSDIDAVKGAVYTAFMAKPQMMQYKDDDATKIKAIVDNINAELDEGWKFEMFESGIASSGAVAYTAIQRDPWDNPYFLYVFTDSFTTTYASGRGDTSAEKQENLKPADSCLYVVIASAGPNGTGVGMGIDGMSYDSATEKWNRASMVLNTDGIDDLGVITRILNGSTLQATFGWEASTFGALQYVNWVFCGSAGENSAATTGIYTMIESSGNVANATYTTTTGSSLDLYPTLEKLMEQNGMASVGKNSPVVVSNILAS